MGVSGGGRHGLYYAEIVAIGVIQKLVDHYRYRISDLGGIYPDLVRMAMHDNLETLRESWLMISHSGHRVILLPRLENTDYYSLNYQKVDVAGLLDRLDKCLKSSDEIQTLLDCGLYDR